MKYTLLLLLTLFTSISLANSEEKITQPLISINAMVDIKGIEQSAEQGAQAMQRMANSLELIAQNRNLTPEQQQNIHKTIENINNLVDVSSDSLQSLPTFLKESKETLSTTSTQFFDDLTFKVILLLAIVVLALVAIIAGFYWFILRPLQNTLLQATTNISTMAKAIENSALSLEMTNKNHDNILQLLSQEKDNQS
jgi:HAMP domain-containing protein